MKKIKLLKNYREYSSQEIISVSNNVAFGLIDQKIARECTNRDFIVKPKLGTSKAFDTLKMNQKRFNIKTK